eukprot:CAMPEP_0197038026 /NCGR_PEP_ID=MMETSP1384-20130603/15082_1 /TAXON_ID=29189 /ORGANISM="Ammonia sp." /LENGTH=367 /DNA_ID=CAMNT_0042468417 /DNA_START=35 /DNA_END=1136 /DNA_ORIENTATION=+
MASPALGFDAWLTSNGIRVPDALKQKMHEKYLDSVDVLTQLKQMNGNELSEVMAELKLTVIEKAIFNAILAKLEASEGAASQSGSASTSYMVIVPEIISITDNKNGAVNIKWKLAQQAVDKNVKNRVKLEWAEDEKALDFDYTNDQIIEINKLDLNTVYETNNIAVNNINANIFRLKWRNFSNAKELKIETDRWDTNSKGQHIEVDGTVIKHKATTAWNSVYGQVVCKAPYTYHWRFRIKAFSAHFMFGVARVSNGDSCKATYLGTKEKGYYAAYTNADTAYVYDGGNNYQGEYGMKRFNKNGCVLDMYLDLKQHTLRFETGGQDTGVTIPNLPEEEYRMIVSLYNQQQIELIAFNTIDIIGYDDSA